MVHQNLNTQITSSQDMKQPENAPQEITAQESTTKNATDLEPAQDIISLVRVSSCDTTPKNLTSENPQTQACKEFILFPKLPIEYVDISQSSPRLHST